jgi:hypothetical protein
MRKKQETYINRLNNNRKITNTNTQRRKPEKHQALAKSFIHRKPLPKYRPQKAKN